LIDLTIAQGGTFYLPYRNYADSRQMNKAYPELDNFISFKKTHDPAEIFSSEFYSYLLRSIKRGNPAP
jgi:hypothetical protein